ncbi:MAG: hypothetical protein RLZZ546_2706, partial [Bacteroidota bacterium]
RFFVFAILFVFLFLTIKGCKKNEVTISYNNEIRPILSDKCFKCHGPDEKQRKSDFRLDTKEGAYALLKNSNGKYGIVSGYPEKSEVFLRINSHDEDYKMPTPNSNLSISQQEIKLIEEWIRQGAIYEEHWSFIKIKKPSVPKTKSDWAFNEIDHFVYEKLKSKKLKPSEQEGEEFLLKRIYHDIIGLPPSLKEQDAFINDNSPDAYEKTVDQLLNNKHYGEKMAIFWMDLSRYADSHGYQDDGLRTMWPWRDWVIHAFNENYSYEKFITWQLAGDLVPNKNKETILATGFNRNHKITQEGGVIDEEYRIEYVSDRTNTFSKGLLAMTFECAKCHDHKYDPISQNDYYSTFAFFNQVNEKGLYGDISIGSLADPPYMTITDEDKAGILAFVQKQDTAQLKVMIMKDSSTIRPTYILNRGQYDQPRNRVNFGTPKAIMAFDTSIFESNRFGLSKWMFHKNNPLTARVFVNLIWQEFFGRGIVKTTGDFGLQGELPTHPELLDWLAADFMEHNWNVKRLVKQIVMSSTYRQTGRINKNLLSIDPENIYLARGPRQRLSGELLKDHILFSSGLLNKQIGGPSIKSYQPKGLWEAATSGRGQLATYIQDHGKELYRRGLYHFIKRTVPPPSMLIFDGSNRDQCEVKRSKTNTPLQALVLMNDPQLLEAARFFSQNLLLEKSSLDQKLNKAFRSILCRQPNKIEWEKIKEFYNKSRKKLSHEKAVKILNVGEKEQSNVLKEDAAALMQTIQLLFNLEESSIR